MQHSAGVAESTSHDRDFFDRWSRTYDDGLLQRSTYRPIHDVVVELIRRIQPSVLLDVGCGTGRLSSRLARLDPAPSIVGVDLSEGMLERAAAGGDLAPVRADSSVLPIAPASIDAIVCIESFHWYADQRMAMRGFRRVLRPGGALVLAGLATFTDAGDQLVRTMTRRRRSIRALPPRRLRSLLDDAGFTVVEQRRIRRFPAPWPLLTHARAA